LVLVTSDGRSCLALAGVEREWRYLVNKREN